jgi:hypothetical protein
MGKKKNWIGLTNNRLTVIAEIDSISVRVSCLCGNIKIIQKDHFKDGHTKSCGCIRAERKRPVRTEPVKVFPKYVHRNEDLSLWDTWQGMRQRCYNPKCKRYSQYGGRGITVCERWKNFDAFFEDVSPRPKVMTLDRVDNDKGYSPDNFRWATVKEQNNNKQQTLKVTVHGKTMSLKEASKILPKSYSALLARKKANNLTPQQVLEFYFGNIN